MQLLVVQVLAGNFGFWQSLIGVGLVGVVASRLTFLLHHFRGQARDMIVAGHGACNVDMPQCRTIFVCGRWTWLCAGAGMSWDGWCGDFVASYRGAQLPCDLVVFMCYLTL